MQLVGKIRKHQVNISSFSKKSLQAMTLSVRRWLDVIATWTDEPLVTWEVSLSGDTQVTSPDSQPLEVPHGRNRRLSTFR